MNDLYAVDSDLLMCCKHKRSYRKSVQLRNVRQVDIMRQICDVYSENAISEAMVRSQCQHAGQTRTMKNEEARPLLVTKNLVEQVNERFHENRRFTVLKLTTFSFNFVIFIAWNCSRKNTLP